MRTEDIHVGDRLRIRSWDDMVDEFGIDEYGYIKCKVDGFPRTSFTEGMRYLCGEEFVVKSFRPDEILSTDEELFSTDSDFFGFGHWTITPAMVEPIEEDSNMEIENPVLSDFLDEWL